MDEVLGGGLPEYSLNLIAGEPGSGKTTLRNRSCSPTPRPRDRALYAGPSGTGETCFGTHFFAAAQAHDECSERLLEIQAAVEQTGAKRRVIDSLTGFELALAPGFREHFRESLYRMLGALTGAGVTIIMTLEVTEAFSELRFSPHAVSFLSENIFILRYAEIDGEQKKVLAIINAQERSFEVTARVRDHLSRCGDQRAAHSRVDDQGSGKTLYRALSRALGG